MNNHFLLSRRTVLKGLGTAIALPWLEAMAPLLSRAAGPGTKQTARRLAFFYVPNGIHMPDWTPAAAGADFSLPHILEPLQPFKQDLLVLSGLTCDKARPHGDGGGDHARALAAFLTGCQPRKTQGADIQAGISVDQVAARKLGSATRFPSLELGCERGPQSGNCDSGYSCVYSSTISWKSSSSPLAKEINPRLLFDRLFGNGLKDESDQNRAKRDLYNQSILDFAAEDARGLRGKLGVIDQRKLDEYLNSIREIEVRLARAQDPSALAPPGTARPVGVPKDYQEHARLLLDLLALAFQGDATRIATFVFANEGSNRSYKAIGVSEAHHELSHHGGKKEKQLKIRAINRFHVSQFAYFLGKLRSVREGDSTLLDQCLLLYGSGVGDGNSHNHDDLPILLAGRGGGGTLTTGRHVRFPKETPLTNLYLALLERMDVPAHALGDSTGKLEFRP